MVFFPFTTGQLTSINYLYHVVQVNLLSPLETFSLARLKSFIFTLISCTIFLSLFLIYFSFVCLSMCVHTCVLLLSLSPLYPVTPPSLLWGEILHFTHASPLSLIIFCPSTLIHSALL